MKLVPVGQRASFSTKLFPVKLIDPLSFFTLRQLRLNQCGIGLHSDQRRFRSTNGKHEETERGKAEDEKYLKWNKGGTSCRSSNSGPLARTGPASSSSFIPMDIPSIPLFSTSAPDRQKERAEARFLGTEKSADGDDSELCSGLGVVSITSRNINTEMDTKVPLLLFFTVVNQHPDIRAYNKRLIHQVDQINRRRQGEHLSDVYEETGKDVGLSIKLGVVDSSKEPALCKKFNIDPHSFPIVYFILQKAYCDTLTGMVEESQAKEAIEAFIDYAKEEITNAKEGKGIYAKIKRHDNDDENAFTLLSKGHKHLQSNEVMQAKKMFTKSLSYAREELKVVNARYGVEGKKLTPELWKKLNREACYNSAPQALCGLAMCEMAVDNRDEAKRITEQIRIEFPFCTKDMQELAEAIVRIELMILTNFDVNRDSYISLMKYENLTSDPLHFYEQQVKLAVAHFMEGAHQRCIETCLRIIRAERKLFPVLKEGGIVDKNLKELSRTTETPARKVILGVMEALGPMNEHVVTGRKMLQLYL